MWGCAPPTGSSEAAEVERSAVRSGRHVLAHRRPPTAPPRPLRFGRGGRAGHQLGCHRSAYAFSQSGLIGVRGRSSVAISTQCQAPPGMGVFSELRIAQVVGVGQLLRHADEIVPRSRTHGILSATSSGLRPTLHEKTGLTARSVASSAADYSASWSMPRAAARASARTVARSTVLASTGAAPCA